MSRTEATLNELDGWRGTNRPLVVAHRGDAHRAPENTLAAFRAAHEAGADAIELDVQLTADGVPVVVHDELLDRTTSGTGPVRALTWSRIRELDAGSWFDPRYAGEWVPALAEVVAWAAETGMRLLVEPKTSPVFDTAAASALAGVLAGSGATVIVYGSDHLLIRELAELAPGVPRGVIVNERTSRTGQLLDEAQAGLLSQSTWCLTPDVVESAHAAGRLVIASARYPGDVALLAGWGVDLIASDRTSLTTVSTQLSARAPMRRSQARWTTCSPL
ncbi:MAG: glycerophosphodiester phosphodiesterase [Mycobacteriales bacterium]